MSSRFKQPKIKVIKRVASNRHTTQMVGLEPRSEPQSCTTMTSDPKNSMTVPMDTVDDRPLCTDNRYKRYRDINASAWEEARQELCASSCLSFKSPPETCSFCQGPGACYRCEDCGPAIYFCEFCVEKEHTRRPLHHLQKWMVRLTLF